uniref:Uncharacterized protein n=1 Tax=Romanomermis culicivorax TaxID=13658 RepID=A0A915I3Y2_ROMCU
MAVERLWQSWRRRFLIGLVYKDWAIRGSNFGSSCIEDTAGFGNGIGQLLNICKTFHLLSDS